MEDRYFWKFNEYSSTREKVWFFSNEVKSFSQVLSCSRSFSGSSFQSGGPFDFCFLKRLSIESLSKTQIHLEDINRFQDLEQLEIGIDQNEESSTQAPSLRLLNLKVLRIVMHWNQSGLEIDAPKLRALQLPVWRQEKGERDLLSLQFKYPESVKFLSIERYTGRRENYLAKFSEIEYFETGENNPY